MKPHEIQVGKTYVNEKGTKRTRRTVLDIGKHIDGCGWYPAGTMLVEFSMPNPLRGQIIHNTSLSSFAAWAGTELKEQ